MQTENPNLVTSPKGQSHRPAYMEYVLNLLVVLVVAMGGGAGGARNLDGTAQASRVSSAPTHDSHLSLCNATILTPHPLPPELTLKSVTGKCPENYEIKCLFILTLSTCAQMRTHTLSSSKDKPATTKIKYEKPNHPPKCSFLGQTR